jgi:hypothetical protein
MHLSLCQPSMLLALLFHDHITWYFAEDIAKEEDGQDPAILIGIQMQIGSHARQLRVCYRLTLASAHLGKSTPYRY